MAIGIAVIEAGKYAGDGDLPFLAYLHAQHIPAIEANKDLDLKAIYSPAQGDAEDLANDADVDAYFDSPDDHGDTLDALIRRRDIEALMVILPLSLRTDLIRKALKVGKHVLSDAPIAEDLETAERILQWYADRDGHALWSVGENYRFKDPILYGYQQLRALHGNVQTFTVKTHNMINEGDNLYRCLKAQGLGSHKGVVLDAGVHQVAALRSLLSAMEVSITEVAAFTSLLRPGISPTDTVSAIVHLSNGNSGTFNFSYGTEFDAASEIQIVTDKGAVTVTDRCVTVVKDGEEEHIEEVIKRDFPREDICLKRMLGVFAKGILEKGEIEQRGLPQEALTDLKIIQAMIESGEEDGAVKTID